MIVSDDYGSKPITIETSYKKMATLWIIDLICKYLTSVNLLHMKLLDPDQKIPITMIS